MEDEQKPGVKRVRLTGARFEGGRLPIDSLVELQKYQDIVRIAAEAEWRSEHPGEGVPAELKESVSLAIERIDEGSADVFLAFEQLQVYVQYQTEARDAVDAVIVAAYSGGPILKLPGLSEKEDTEFREAVAQVGSTLGPEQSIEFYPDGPDAKPITITIETHREAVAHLSRIEDFLVPPDLAPNKQGLVAAEESLVARITTLYADDDKFDFVLADGNVLHGWFRQNPALLEDLRNVVNPTAKGALTRISGSLQYKDGKPFRFWETSAIERVEFDDTAWGERLTAFAALPTGWDDGGGTQIASIALEGAQMVLRAVSHAQDERPGVFPTSEGGVLVEWARASRVLSVEVLADGSFEMFSLRRDEREGTHSATADVTQAIAFVEAEKE